MTNLGAGYQHISHDRPLIEQDLDAYRMPAKLAEPTVCPECSAVFHKGRWQWLEAPTGAHHETCPACKRTHDNFPAGYVTLEGPYFNAHSEEILRTVQNHERHERLEHPLKRIIATERQGDTTLVTTTDIHLARGIAEAIKYAFQGELELHYNPGENFFTGLLAALVATTLPLKLLHHFLRRVTLTARQEGSSSRQATINQMIISFSLESSSQTITRFTPAQPDPKLTKTFGIKCIWQNNQMRRK